MRDVGKTMGAQRRRSLWTGLLLVGSIFVLGRLARGVVGHYRHGDQDGDAGRDGTVMTEVRRAGLPAAASSALEAVGKVTSTKTLGPASLLGAVALYPRHPAAALFVLVNTAGTLLAQRLIKMGLQRPRPEEHREDGSTSSFPSGHSSLTTSLALTASLIAAKEFQRYEGRVTTIALTLAVLIGISRALLRQHYPSDVLAGHAVGAACVLANNLWYERGRE